MSHKIKNYALLITLTLSLVTLTILLRAPPFRGKINESFHVENEKQLASFLYKNFNKKTFLNLLVKIVTQKPLLSKLMHFQDELVHLFFLQNEVHRSKRIDEKLMGSMLIFLFFF